MILGWSEGEGEGESKGGAAPRRGGGERDPVMYQLGGEKRQSYLEIFLRGMAWHPLRGDGGSMCPVDVAVGLKYLPQPPCRAPGPG